MRGIKRVYFTLTDCGIDLGELVDNTPEAEKLVNLLSLRNKYKWIIYQDYKTEEESEQPNLEKVDEWKNNFKIIYETTKERYTTIIKLYNDNKDKLLEKIKSTSINRYNDTPQNIGGQYDELDYATNIATSTTEHTPGELMDRINNIQSKLRDVYYDWLKEFIFIFGESIL